MCLPTTLLENQRTVTEVTLKPKRNHFTAKTIIVNLKAKLLKKRNWSSPTLSTTQCCWEIY